MQTLDAVPIYKCFCLVDIGKKLQREILAWEG